MQVTEFINRLNLKKTESEKQRLISSIMDRLYIPIMEKISSARMIKELSNGNVFDRYILTCLSIIVLYTKLDIDLSNYKIEDFDTLNENKIFDAVVNNIDRNEINEYNMIIDMIFEK